jgi:hypothetical protein
MDEELLSLEEIKEILFLYFSMGVDYRLTPEHEEQIEHLVDSLVSHVIDAAVSKFTAKIAENKNHKLPVPGRSSKKETAK